MDLQVLGWRVLADAEATRLAHEAMSCGGPEACGCVYCRNFAASREQAYPSQALDLFVRLGIRWDRETEIGAPVKLAEGRWLYSGWFHFVGQIVDGPKSSTAVATIPAQGDIQGGSVYALEYQCLVDGFEMGLSEQTHLLPDAFGDQHAVQLEFSTEVPWVLSEQEPES